MTTDKRPHGNIQRTHDFRKQNGNWQRRMKNTKKWCDLHVIYHGPTIQTAKSGGQWTTEKPNEWIWK